eukprot:Skav226465  [mRNA]  locus=scaffold1781:117629:118366:+ [translate_table: standard]
MGMACGWHVGGMWVACGWHGDGIGMAWGGTAFRKQISCIYTLSTPYHDKLVTCCHLVETMNCRRSRQAGSVHAHLQEPVASKENSSRVQQTAPKVFKSRVSPAEYASSDWKCDQVCGGLSPSQSEDGRHPTAGAVAAVLRG